MKVPIKLFQKKSCVDIGNSKVLYTAWHEEMADHRRNMLDLPFSFIKFLFISLTQETCELKINIESQSDITIHWHFQGNNR